MGAPAVGSMTLEQYFELPWADREALDAWMVTVLGRDTVACGIRTIDLPDGQVVATCLSYDADGRPVLDGDEHVVETRRFLRRIEPPCWVTP